jgi:hypothetical protein
MNMLACECDTRGNPINVTRVEICIPVEYIYFTNALFAIFHTSLTLTYVYRARKPGNANLTTTQISHCMKRVNVLVCIPSNFHATKNVRSKTSTYY